MASVNVSSINIIDPRNRHTVYSAQLPAVHTASDGVTAAEGVVFTVPYLGGNYGIAVHVSATPSGAVEGPLLKVFGAAWDGPSVAPTDRNWSICRGDTATGTNVLLNAVSCNQMITVLSPAVAYKVAVSSATTAAGGPVTTAITFRVFAFDKTFNW